MLPSRTTPDLLGGMWALLQDAKAVPSRLLWDNESGIGRRRPTAPAHGAGGRVRRVPGAGGQAAATGGIQSPRARSSG